MHWSAAGLGVLQRGWEGMGGRVLLGRQRWEGLRGGREWGCAGRSEFVHVLRREEVIVICLSPVTSTHRRRTLPNNGKQKTPRSDRQAEATKLFILF